MTRQSTATRVVAFTCVLIAGALFAWNLLPAHNIQDSPNVSFQTIDGRQFKLSELRGYPVLVTFWATTCVTCVGKVPELKALYKKFRPLGLEFIAIAMAYDPPNRILSFTRDKALPYAVAMDLDGALARAFDEVELTPTTFLIDSHGKIVFDKTGDFEIKILEQIIFDLLNDQKHKPGLASI